MDNLLTPTHYLSISNIINFFKKINKRFGFGFGFGFGFFNNYFKYSYQIYHIKYMRIIYLLNVTQSAGDFYPQKICSSGKN